VRFLEPVVVMVDISSFGHGCHSLHSPACFIHEDKVTDIMFLDIIHHPVFI
jgi:hypothetical protein